MIFNILPFPYPKDKKNMQNQNQNQSSNFLQRFKGGFWQYCLDNNIFTTNGDSQHIIQLIDQISSNYQTQILQINNPSQLYPTLASELQIILKNEQNHIGTAITRDDIMKSKKEDFESKLQNKQNEFNEMFKRDTPQNVEFNDNIEDEPLSSESLERLIQDQMKQRGLLNPPPPVLNEKNEMSKSPETVNVVETKSSPPNHNNISDRNFVNKISNIDEKNTVILDNNNPIPSQTLSQSIPNISPLSQLENDGKNLRENAYLKDILETLNQISEMQKIQNKVLNKLALSQISILQKLK